MQPAKEQVTTNQWVSTAVSIVFVGIAIILFGVVISQLGLLNGLLNRETAVPSNTIHITAEAMRFGQAKLRVKAGEEVTLVLDNHDFYGHSFDVDELDLHLVMEANGRSTITFTPTEPGTYEIYCGVPGHHAAGMVSTLIVEP